MSEVWFFIVGMVIALAFGVLMYMLTNDVFKGTNRDLQNLQSCQGLVGTLGGREGKCFADKTCGGFVQGGTRDYSLFDAGTGKDFYFQYIGEGWGCEKAILKDKDGNPVQGINGKAKEAPYCCIMLDSNENPLNAKSVNAARCQSMSEGAWGYFAAALSSGDCNQMDPNTVINRMPIDQEITFSYKPAKTDELCSVHMAIQGGSADFAISLAGVNNGGSCYDLRDPKTGVVKLPISVLRYVDALAAATPNSRIERAQFNNPSTPLDVTLTSGPRSNPKTMHITLGLINPNKVYYCAYTSDEGCSGILAGSSITRRSDSTVGTCTLTTENNYCRFSMTGQSGGASRYCRLAYDDHNNVISNSYCNGFTAPCKITAGNSIIICQPKGTETNACTQQSYTTEEAAGLPFIAKMNECS